MNNTGKKYVCILAAFMLSFFMLSTAVPETVLASSGRSQSQSYDDRETSTDAVTAKFETFETLVTDLISVLGTIYTLWGISEWGLAWHESNGTMGGQSFKRIFGGLVVVLSPQILAVLG